MSQDLFNGLSREQMRDLLMRVRDLVGDLPAYTQRSDDGSHIYDPYLCCSGNEGTGHDAWCVVRRLKEALDVP